MVGNPIVPIPATNALQAIEHSADMVAPTIEHFVFDQEHNILQIFFSESVNVTSFDVTGLTIQGLMSTTSPAFFHRLTTSTASVNDSLASPGDAIVDILLSDHDTNAIKALALVASERSNTYLAVFAGSVNDMSGNPIATVPVTGAIPARDYTADISSPRLNRFTVHLGNETVVLVFSETVNATSLNPAEITFQSGADSTATFAYTLTGGSTTSQHGTDIVLALSRADADNLKVLENCSQTKTTHSSLCRLQ